jgi:hypothetical protein
MKEFFFISISLSSLYLWESGIPQVSHIIYPLLLFIIIVADKVKFPEESKWLMLFICCSVLINLFYYMIYIDSSFVTSAIQMVFDMIVYLAVYNMLMKYDRCFRTLIAALLVGVLIQWVVYFSGFGNYYFYPRYSGTFNDPNQMAYWFLCIVCCAISVHNYREISIWVIWPIIASFFYFSFLTMSRSVVLAIPFIVIAISYKVLGRKRLIRYFILLVPLVIVSISLVSKDITLLERFSNVDIKEQLHERGYYRIIDYPEYTLIGAGHGYHERFNIGKPIGQLSAEVHSTPVGLLFYYGIFGLLLIAVFFWKIFKRLGAVDRLLFFSVFAYGIATYSVRTPIFWVLMAYFSVVSFKKFGGSK